MPFICNSGHQVYPTLADVIGPAVDPAQRVPHTNVNLNQYLLHVGIAHGLCNTFALVVAGPGSYGIHVAPVVLTLRVDLRIYEKARDNETSLFLPHTAPSSLLGTMSIYDGPTKPFTTEACSREAVLWAPSSVSGPLAFALPQ